MLKRWFKTFSIQKMNEKNLAFFLYHKICPSKVEITPQLQDFTHHSGSKLSVDSHLHPPWFPNRNLCGGWVHPGQLQTPLVSQSLSIACSGLCISDVSRNNKLERSTPVCDNAKNLTAFSAAASPTPVTVLVLSVLLSIIGVWKKKVRKMSSPFLSSKNLGLPASLSVEC